MHTFVGDNFIKTAFVLGSEFEDFPNLSTLSFINILEFKPIMCSILVLLSLTYLSFFCVFSMFGLEVGSLSFTLVLWNSIAIRKG